MQDIYSQRRYLTEILIQLRNAVSESSPHPPPMHSRQSRHNFLYSLPPTVYILLKLVLRPEPNFGFNVVFRHVSSHFWCGTKEWWRFDPSHLQQYWNHKSYALLLLLLLLLLRHDISIVSLLSFVPQKHEHRIGGVEDVAAGNTRIDMSSCWIATRVGNDTSCYSSIPVSMPIHPWQPLQRHFLLLLRPKLEMRCIVSKQHFLIQLNPAPQHQRYMIHWIRRTFLLFRIRSCLDLPMPHSLVDVLGISN